MPVDERDKVLEGRDGFLFLIDDGTAPPGQQVGRQLTDAQLEEWRVLLEGRMERAAAIGAQYLFVVAPDTRSVYPEMLPSRYRTAARRPVHQLIEHLESCGSPASVLYPVDELIAHKCKQPVCERVGTHWTDFGAFIAYRAILEALADSVAGRVLTERDIYYMDGVSGMDLGGKLDPPRTETVRAARVVHNAGHPVYDNCVFSTGSLIATTCGVAPPTRCILFGDSYMYGLLKFFPDTFGRVVFAHRASIPEDLLEAERPNLVLSVMAERDLVRVPQDIAGPKQGELEQQRRAARAVRGPYAPQGTRINLATVAQVEAVRARMLAAGGVCDATIVSLLAYAGLGSRDVLTLRWRDVGGDHLHVPPRGGGDRVRRVPLWPSVTGDLRRWQEERPAAGTAHVIYDDGEGWGVSYWGDWRERCYTPAVRSIGLGRLAPWGLHNTYVHLRLIEGARPVEVAAEIGTPVHDYAVARAAVVAGGDCAPRSGEAAIQAARAALDASGSGTGR